MYWPFCRMAAEIAGFLAPVPLNPTLFFRPRSRLLCEPTLEAGSDIETRGAGLLVVPVDLARRRRNPVHRIAAASAGTTTSESRVQRGAQVGYNRQMPLFEIVREEAGLTERRFELSVDGEPVPGLVWSPSGGAGTGPVVLVGHGRTSHKRNPHILGLAQLMVGSCGWSAVALDAPDHGERRPPDLGPNWPRPDADQVVHEWQACTERQWPTARSASSRPAGRCR
jgi:hypothetical protein